MIFPPRLPGGQIAHHLLSPRMDTDAPFSGMRLATFGGPTYFDNTNDGNGNGTGTSGASGGNGASGGGNGSGDGNGNGNGGEGDGNGAGPNGTGGGNGANDGANGAPAPKSGDNPDDAGKRVFSQSDVDRIVKERLDQANRSAAQKAEADRRKAEADRLRESGEFKILSEQREAELNELRPKAEAAERYASRIHQIINDEIKDWPKEVKASDPGPEHTDARMTWVETHRDLAKVAAAARKHPDDDLGKNGPAPGSSEHFDRIRKEQEARNQAMAPGGTTRVSDRFRRAS